MAQISAKNFDFWYMDGSLFLQNGYMDGGISKIPAAHPYPDQSWVPLPPPPDRNECEDEDIGRRRETGKNFEDMNHSWAVTTRRASRQGRSQTFQNEGAARGLRGEQGGLTGLKMAALHRRMYKVQFHLGARGGKSFCQGGGRPPPTPLWLRHCFEGGKGCAGKQIIMFQVQDWRYDPTGKPLDGLQTVS